MIYRSEEYMKTYYEVDSALKNKDTKRLKELEKDNINDFAYENNFAILYASEYDLNEVFKLLIKNKQIRKNVINPKGFYNALLNGNIEILNIYLKEKRLKRFQKELSENITKYFIEVVEIIIEDIEYFKELNKNVVNSIKKYKKIFELILKEFKEKNILNKLKKDNFESYKKYKIIFCLEDMIKNF